MNHAPVPPQYLVGQTIDEPWHPVSHQYLIGQTVEDPFPAFKVYYPYDPYNPFWAGLDLVEYGMRVKWIHTVRDGRFSLLCHPTPFPFSRLCSRGGMPFQVYTIKPTWDGLEFCPPWFYGIHGAFGLHSNQYPTTHSTCPNMWPHRRYTLLYTESKETERGNCWSVTFGIPTCLVTSSITLQP